MKRVPNRTLTTTLRPVVAELAQRGDVVAVAAVVEARALDEVGAGDQRGDEQRDLGRVGRAVGVDHHDDVAGAGGEAAGQGVALAGAGLLHDHHVRAQLAGHRDGAVDRAAVDQDHLVDARGQRGEDVRQVPLLVHRRDHHAYCR